MKIEEKDKLDELFHSKLYDFEADTNPEDWDAIAGRLPEPETVVLPRRTWRYWSAAAGLALAITTGTLLLSRKDIPEQPIAQQMEQDLPPTVTPDQPATTMIAESGSVSSGSSQTTYRTVREKVTGLPLERKEVEAVRIRTIEKIEIGTQTLTIENIQATAPLTVRQQQLIADAAPVSSPKTKSPVKRWGFGMGGGSLSAGAENTIPGLVMYSSSVIPDEDALFMNTIKNAAVVTPDKIEKQEPKTNINHSTPVSVGLSASYYLTDRWSLISGLTYTMLSSKWEQQDAIYYKKTRQRLHYIGIHLSASYRIAEWNSFQVYAAAGGMVEYNVGRKLRIETYDSSVLQEVNTEKADVENKWLFSLNARAGVSYPVFRFVSAFAEVGGAYYFDTKKSPETIHTEKPFNVSFNFGFRLGFEII